MTIDVILTEEEISNAIYEYLNKQGLITDDFVLVKKYPSLNSYTFTNVKEDDGIPEV